MDGRQKRGRERSAGESEALWPWESVTNQRGRELPFLCVCVCVCTHSCFSCVFVCLHVSVYECIVLKCGLFTQQRVWKREDSKKKGRHGTPHVCVCVCVTWWSS